MPDRTAFVALLGVAVYGFGLYGWSRMKFRVLGTHELMRNVPNLSRRYNQLVRTGDAPAWPLVAWRVCLPLSVAIAIAAILLSG